MIQIKNNISKKEDIEIEYTLSNEDIKFPTFFDLEICKILKTQKMSKETLINDLNTLINELKYIIDTLINISKKDLNDFNRLCLYYKINSFDYIIINLMTELIQVILKNVENNGEPLDLSLFDENLNKNYVDTELFLSQHKINDKQFTNISSSEYINELKEICSSEHECGILFMCNKMKYCLSFVFKVKNKLNEYIEIKDF